VAYVASVARSKPPNPSGRGAEGLNRLVPVLVTKLVVPRQLASQDADPAAVSAQHGARHVEPAVLEFDLEPGRAERPQRDRTRRPQRRRRTPIDRHSLYRQGCRTLLLGMSEEFSR
jgi:hypothetical protein